jgi:hypothetical protein
MKLSEIKYKRKQGHKTHGGDTWQNLHYQFNPFTVMQTLCITTPNNCLQAHLLVLYSILSPMLCMIGSPLSSACPKIAWSLGKKRRQSVAVVDVKMSVVIVTNAKVARSEIRFASTTTMALVITTLYTLMPMYCESLRAGIFTCLKGITKIWLIYTLALSVMWMKYNKTTKCRCLFATVCSGISRWW